MFPSFQVKADDKTRAFLDEYEQMMSRTDADDQLELSAIKSITAILQALTQGLPLPAIASTAMTGANSLPSAPLDALPSKPVNPSGDPYAVPAHLHDLASDELPEESREVVLDQIASFRQQSAEREKAKKAMEEEKERRRIEMMVQNQAAMKAREAAGGARERELAIQKGREREREREQAFIRGGDAQSYNKPIGFVAGRQEKERTDEEEEEARQERRRRDQADSLKEVRLLTPSSERSVDPLFSILD
jgi:RNA-binding protein 25